MFTSNPWGSYLGVLSALLVGYYLFVGLRFYGRDLWTRIGIKSAFQHGPARIIVRRSQELDSQQDLADPALLPTSASHLVAQNSYTTTDLDGPAQGPFDEFPGGLQQLRNDLNQAVEEAYLKDYDKEELVLLLQLTLKSQHSLIGTAFQTSVNEHIQTECAKYGSMHLSTADLVEIWKQ
nr:hypothetical protein [uncultured Dyadobacter sp.]